MAPIYTVKCPVCGNKTEVITKMGEVPEKRCWDCPTVLMVKQVDKPFFPNSKRKKGEVIK